MKLYWSTLYAPHTNADTIKVYGKYDAWETFGHRMFYVIINRDADGWYLGTAPSYTGILNLNLTKLEGVTTLEEAKATVELMVKLE